MWHKRLCGETISEDDDALPPLTAADLHISDELKTAVIKVRECVSCAVVQCVFKLFTDSVDDCSLALRFAGTPLRTRGWVLAPGLVTILF